MNQQTSFEKVKEFHEVFDRPGNKNPEALTPDEAVVRAVFSTEEILEFLYASVGGETEAFENIVKTWQESTNSILQKIVQEQKPVHDRLVAQADALTDANYFNYGSFVLMGLNPDPIFNIVHRANMGKLFPDGKPRYRKNDGKVLKPDHWERDYAPETRIAEEVKRQKKTINEGKVK